MQEQHQKFMKEALAQAKKAAQNHEVPIGAVLVNKAGVIIGVSHNQVEQLHTQTAHAELLAMQQGTQKLQDWRLIGCTLYVTLEPCTMCCAALQLSRIETVVFGAKSPVFGYQKDQDQFIKPVDFAFKFISGVLEPECAKLLQEFFEHKRD